MTEPHNKPDLTATLKSQDTEEWLDIHFTRPLGLRWALFFNRFDVHPNVVTILSMVLGVAAAVMFYYTDLVHTLVGILLLVWANLYDSADGQLARMTGKKTLWGRILDGFAGDVWFFSIYVAICLRLYSQPIPGTDTPWGLWIWVIAIVAGFGCHGPQSRLADYYRNIHLYFLKGDSGSELQSAAQLRQEYRSLHWPKDWAWMIFLRGYISYTARQEAITPAFQRLIALLHRRFGATADRFPQELRQAFRAGSLPLMKYANILTFNVRAIVLYICLLVGQPWIYLAFEITVMYLIYFYMRSRHEHLCRRLYDKYQDSQATA